MSADKRYADLKKVLRAILISVSRDGVSVRNLEKIYQEQEGKRIPLLGHSTTVDLLNSMTDTVYTVRLAVSANIIRKNVYVFHFLN